MTMRCREKLCWPRIFWTSLEQSPSAALSVDAINIRDREFNLYRLDPMFEGNLRRQQHPSNCRPQGGEEL